VAGPSEGPARRASSWPARDAGRPLPYPDGSFDVVVADEILADIAPQRREEFLRELLRVARERVVVTIPSRAAVRAGAALMDLLKDHPGLARRDPEAVPTPQEVAALLDTLNAAHVMVPSHHLGSWILATVFGHLDLPVAIAQRVASLLREHAAPHETVEPCRSHVFTAAVPGSMLAPASGDSRASATLASRL